MLFPLTKKNSIDSLMSSYILLNKLAGGSISIAQTMEKINKDVQVKSLINLIIFSTERPEAISYQ